MPSYSESTLSGVFAKTEGHCCYCGASLWRNKLDGAGDGSWSVDRWRPRSRLRTAAEADGLDNLWPICSSCKVDKAETTGSEYLWSRHAGKQRVLWIWRAWLKDMED